MSQTLAPTDWAGARGKKWCDDLAFMEPMLAFIDAPLIEALHLDGLHHDGPLRIADIGCGGGRTSLEILQRAPAGSSIHGFDISPDLIEVARRGLREKASGQEDDIVFHLSDVETAPPPSKPYDRLVSRFGIMFFENPSRAFTNLATWLAPGGCFAFAVWGPRGSNPWITGFSDAAAGLIDMPPPDPQAPGPLRYGGGKKLLTLLDEAGLHDLNISDWRGVLSLGGGLPVEETVDFTLNSILAQELLANVPETTREKVRQRLEAHYAPYMRDGGVWMEGHIHIVTGMRPT